MPKILIIDDDVTITELLKTLVKMEGHTPTTVNDMPVVPESPSTSVASAMESWTTVAAPPAPMNVCHG